MPVSDWNKRASVLGLAPANRDQSSNPRLSAGLESIASTTIRIRWSRGIANAKRGRPLLAKLIQNDLPQAVLWAV
jgi:hypothetical protein